MEGAPDGSPTAGWNDRSKGFLISSGDDALAMIARSGRPWLPAATACLLFAGIFTPLVVFGQASSSSQESQLAALVGAAVSSRSYASGAIGYAAAMGLSTSAAQAQLNQGDSLLATARADLQSGTGLAAGIQAAQAAMSAYDAAAVSSSLALGSAGLTASVDYDAALSAVTEVNATVNVIASVGAQACGTAGTAAPGAQAFVQACAQINAQLTSARADLVQAASLLVQSSGRIAATADVSQAVSLVAQARSDTQACQSLLLTVASYTYSQRGSAYVSAFVDPLYAEANKTLMSEESVMVNLTRYQSSWTAYTQSQSSAVAGVSSSGSALGTAISQVNTGAVSTGISAASATAGDVIADLSALLNITGISALTNLASAIQACAAAATSYNNALASANSWSSAYGGTQLSAFSGYLNAGSSAAAIAQSDGSAYVSAYQTVVADLSAYVALVPPALYDSFTALPVSSTVTGANAALSQSVSAAATVQADISSLNTAVSTGEAAILVSSQLLSTASGVSTAGGAYLNATTKSSLGEVSATASATAQAAQSFVSSAQACLQASAGSYSSAAASLDASGVTLGAQTQGATSAAANAVIYLQSDMRIRTAALAGGKADLAEAFQLFSSPDVPAGVAAIARATLEFQAASSASA